MIKLIRNILIMIAITFLISSLSKNIFDYQKKIGFYKNYQQEYESELKKNKQLKSNILKSKDYYTAEKDIRNKLNRIKPDEMLVIVPKLTLAPSPQPEVIKSPQKQWLELFLK